MKSKILLVQHRRCFSNMKLRINIGNKDSGTVFNKNSKVSTEVKTPEDDSSSNTKRQLKDQTFTPDKVSLIYSREQIFNMMRLK